MDILGNLLAGVEVFIDGALDVVIGDEFNRAGETTESNLVVMN